MPIYEYLCEECGKEFEVFSKISSEPLSKCKDCNGKLKKIISNSSFHLKGDGWFADGYSKDEKYAKKRK